MCRVELEEAREKVEGFSHSIAAKRRLYWECVTSDKAMPVLAPPTKVRAQTNSTEAPPTIAAVKAALVKPDAGLPAHCAHVTCPDMKCAESEILGSRPDGHCCRICVKKE